MTAVRSLALAMCLLAARPGFAAQVVDARYSAMASRLFPALETVRPEALPADTRRMLTARLARIGTCGQDSHCIVQKAIWTGEEASLLARTAGTALARTNAVAAIDDGVPAQVARELTGLNSVLQVYGLGLPPRNAEIDGPIYKIGGLPFAARVSDAVAINSEGGVETGLDPSIGLALSLLDMNGRTEAADLEPLDAKYNAAALARARTIDWSRYAYSAILVPGNGPELSSEALSPRGKLRVRIAAERFAAKAAPFIIVSGGAVHPRGTTIREAVEMRRALIDWYGIPEAAIILEPYARYTYTNIRNAVRRLHAVHAPLDRKMLVISDAEHIRYITGPIFRARGIATLGYAPGAVEPGAADSDALVTPAIASLRIDPLDPLDP